MKRWKPLLALLMCLLLAACTRTTLYADLDERQANEVLAALLSTGIGAEKRTSASKTGWEIRVDQSECMGCLSQCSFSSWADNEKNSTGRLADPRSFCIQKTLQDIAHGGPVDNNLMFAGHSAFRFKTDPFYSNGFVPTVKQLVDRIRTGA